MQVQAEKERGKTLYVASLVCFIVGIFTFVPQIASIAITLSLVRDGFVVKEKTRVLVGCIVELVAWVLFPFLVGLQLPVGQYTLNYRTYINYTYVGWIYIIVWAVVTILWGIMRMKWTQTLDGPSAAYIQHQQKLVRQHKERYKNDMTTNGEASTYYVISLSFYILGIFFFIPHLVSIVTRFLMVNKLALRNCLR